MLFGIVHLGTLRLTGSLRQRHRCDVDRWITAGARALELGGFERRDRGVALDRST
jgi:hypothetical protein